MTRSRIANQIADLHVDPFASPFANLRANRRMDNAFLFGNIAGDLKTDGVQVDAAAVVCVCIAIGMVTSAFLHTFGTDDACRNGAIVVENATRGAPRDVVMDSSVCTVVVASVVWNHRSALDVGSSVVTGGPGERGGVSGCPEETVVLEEQDANERGTAYRSYAGLEQSESVFLFANIVQTSSSCQCPLLETVT